MRLTRCQRLLILLTALWLPLQAVAGMTMQFCRHDSAPQNSQAVTAAASVEEHCPYHDAGAAPAAQDRTHDQKCDNCGICHLACSGYMPASEVKTDIAPLAHVYQRWPAAARTSHIPEPPQYPPRHSA